MKHNHLFFILFIFALHLFNAICCKSLRVVTFNINSEISWDKKKRQIIKILKTLNADVICLQEINKKNAQELSTKLNMNWDKNAWHESEITILSKSTILQSLTLDIPESYYNAFVAIEIENIWITSTHLWSEDYKVDDSFREYELNFIMDRLESLNCNNIIMAGDFNSLDNSDISDSLIMRGYVDTHKNQPWSRGTWMPTNDHERIDRIHFKGNFKILNGKVMDHNDFDWLQEWPTGNDHRLVVTDLEI